MQDRFSENGSVLLVVLLVVLVSLGVVGYFLLAKKPSSSLDPKVTLQTTVKNPFDKNAQYVNPFSGYKNPFDTAK